MRIFSIIGKLAIALAFVVLCNYAISFALVPEGSKSQLAWTDFAQQEEMDTVIVGSSIVHYALDPQVMNEVAGTKAYTLATPSQSIEDSFVAIQTAYERFGVKRVVLGTSFTSLSTPETPNPASAFLSRRGIAVSPIEVMKANALMLFHYGAWTEPESINMLFPWASDHVTPSASTVAANVRVKLSGADIYEAAHLMDPTFTYGGLGFGIVETVLDYNSDIVFPYFRSRDRMEGVPADEDPPYLDEDRARTLDEICAYCADRDIELIVVEPTMPAFNVIEYGDDYAARYETLRAFFAERGVAFYDFNFAKPELFAWQTDYFCDATHLNYRGSREFSESFSRFMMKVEAGESVEGLFMTFDEYLASIDWIDAVLAETNVSERGLTLTATALAGSGVKVEYQMCAQDAQTGEWLVVRDWDADPTCAFEPAAHGVVHLRVNARQQGSDAEWERYREIAALY